MALKDLASMAANYARKLLVVKRKKKRRGGFQNNQY